MVKLCSEVALVASGRQGLGLTHDSDAHVYLIDGGDDLALVDVGTGLATDVLLDLVAADGYDSSHIRYAFVTHPHADHGGGANSIRERTGAIVAASPVTARYLRTADEVGFMLDTARATGRYPGDYRLDACEVGLELEDGQQVEVGNLRVQALSTPGHTDGDMCFWMQGRERTYLFTGDTLFFGGRVSLHAGNSCSLPLLRDSIARLSELAVDALMPGHMLFTLRNGGEHVAAAQAAFLHTDIPPYK